MRGRVSLLTQLLLVPVSVSDADVGANLTDSTDRCHTVWNPELLLYKDVVRELLSCAMLARHVVGLPLPHLQVTRAVPVCLYVCVCARSRLTFVTMLCVRAVRRRC